LPFGGAGFGLPVVGLVTSGLPGLAFLPSGWLPPVAPGSGRLPSGLFAPGWDPPEAGAFAGRLEGLEPGSGFVGVGFSAVAGLSDAVCWLAGVGLFEPGSLPSGFFGSGLPAFGPFGAALSPGLPAAG